MQLQPYIFARIFFAVSKKYAESLILPNITLCHPKFFSKSKLQGKQYKIAMVTLYMYV